MQGEWSKDEHDEDLADSLYFILLLLLLLFLRLEITSLNFKQNHVLTGYR